MKKTHTANLLIASQRLWEVLTKHTYLRSLQLDAGGWGVLGSYWGLLSDPHSRKILWAFTSSQGYKKERRRRREEGEAHIRAERLCDWSCPCPGCKCPKSQEAYQAMVHQKHQEKVGFTRNVGLVRRATPKINIFVNNKATTTQTPFIDIHLICKFQGVTAMQMIFPFPSFKPDKMENPVYICHISHILASLH